MKINKNEIAVKLRKLKGIINRKAEETGLNGVLFKDNYLYATNLDIGIKAKLNIENTGECFIIPKAAIDLIENLPDGFMEIDGNDKTVSIKSGTIKNRYKTHPASSYNEMLGIPVRGGSVTVQSGDLLDALDSIMYAISENAKKEQLKGVLLDANNGNLNIVGCDGFRIAWSRIKYNGEFKVIIPKSAIKQILTMGITGEMSFEWNDSGILFRSEEYEVYSRVLSGTYIDYERMFVEHPNQTVIDRRMLSECLKRAIICSGDKTRNAVICRFEKDNLKVTLCGNTSEYEEKIALDRAVDNVLEIGFNGRYLLEAISSFMTEDIVLKMGDATQAIIIEDKELSAMVLPVKIKE